MNYRVGFINIMIFDAFDSSCIACLEPYSPLTPLDSESKHFAIYLIFSIQHHIRTFLHLLHRHLIFSSK
jgi:hypothetical protein